MDLTLFKNIQLPAPRLSIAKPLNLSPDISTNESPSPKRPPKLKLIKKLTFSPSQKRLAIITPTNQEAINFDPSNSISISIQSPTNNPNQDLNLNMFQANLKDMHKESPLQKDAKGGSLTTRPMIDTLFEVKGPKKLKRCLSETEFFKVKLPENKLEPTKPVVSVKLRSEKDILQASRIAKQENQKLQKNKTKKETLQFHLNLAKALDKTEEKHLVDKRKTIMIQRVKTDGISYDQGNPQSPRSAVFNRLHIDSKTPYYLQRQVGSQLSPTSCRSQALVARSPRMVNDIYEMSTDCFTHTLPANSGSLTERAVTKVKSTSTIPNIHQSPNHKAQVSQFEISSARERSEEALTSRAWDVFSRDVMYNNNKMPFSLAVSAKLRHGLLKGVKDVMNIKTRRTDPRKVAELKIKLEPEERAKFMMQMNNVEKEKKYKEMTSKDGYSNAVCQILAMNKASQKRLKSRLGECLPANSRFLNF